ncbi:MAG TPA: hypothetical protein VLB67_16350 [Acidimicrobiia bacterium]|nr:hypothetical protein [Acidimicrobiia bacterium]
MNERRLVPNPWVAIPSLGAGTLGAWITYLVMDVSCRVEVDGAIETCTGLAMTLAAAVFAVTTVGMAVVLVLVYRSIAEYRDAQSKGEEPPGPGCETG